MPKLHKTSYKQDNIAPWENAQDVSTNRIPIYRYPKRKIKWIHLSKEEKLM